MGVLPLQFKGGDNKTSLGLNGTETYNITGISGGLTAGQDVEMTITYADGTAKNVTLLARLDTADEVDYYQSGGILHYVLRQIAKG